MTALEPATAAIIPQPTTFTCNKPPGKLDNIGARPLNISEESLVLKSISPIHINKGNAVNAQFQLASHNVLARSDPTGAGVKNSNKMYPRVINAGATFDQDFDLIESDDSGPLSLVGFAVAAQIRKHPGSIKKTDFLIIGFFIK